MIENPEDMRNTGGILAGELVCWNDWLVGGDSGKSESNADIWLTLTEIWLSRNFSQTGVMGVGDLISTSHAVIYLCHWILVCWL